MHPCRHGLHEDLEGFKDFDTGLNLSQTKQIECFNCGSQNQQQEPIPTQRYHIWHMQHTQKASQDHAMWIVSRIKHKVQQAGLLVPEEDDQHDQYAVSVSGNIIAKFEVGNAGLSA